MRTICSSFIALLFLVFLFPLEVGATESTGGGYVLHGQVNQISGVASGNGFSVQAEGEPIASSISGNGFSGFGGLSKTSPASPTSPTSSSGTGGIFLPPVTVTSNEKSELASSNKTFSQIVAETALGNVPYRADPFPDNKIDILDFNVLMINWGKTTGDSGSRGCTGKIFADINCDSKVDVLDFNLLMVYWGKWIGRQ